MALRKLLANGGNHVIISLKIGNRPAVQALIKEVERNHISGESTHVVFYQVAATEMLKVHVQLHFVNHAPVASISGMTLLRSLSEVMVECLPEDLPYSIQVDLSQLNEVGDVIRVGNLKVGPAVNILTHSNDMVAGAQQQAVSVKVEKAEA